MCILQLHRAAQASNLLIHSSLGWQARHALWLRSQPCCMGGKGRSQPSCCCIISSATGWAASGASSAAMGKRVTWHAMRCACRWSSPHPPTRSAPDRWTMTVRRWLQPGLCLRQKATPLAATPLGGVQAAMQRAHALRAC